MRRKLYLISVLVRRELNHFIRCKPKLSTSFINAVIWVLFFSIGRKYLMGNAIVKTLFLILNFDYMVYIVPGIVLATVFISSFVSGINIILDRDKGFLIGSLATPAPEGLILTGEVMGSSLIALLQGIIVAMALIPTVPEARLEGLIGVFIASLTSATFFGSLAQLIALRLKNIESFYLITSSLILPFLLLSGAFIPLSILPFEVKVVTYLNPLTYAVDVTRYFMINYVDIGIFLDLLVLVTSSLLSLFLLLKYFKEDRILER